MATLPARRPNRLSVFNTLSLDFDVPMGSSSAIVELSANRAAAPIRNPIGARRFGFDQSLTSEFGKHFCCAIGQDMAVAREAEHVDNTAVAGPLVADVSALCEHV